MLFCTRAPRARTPRSFLSARSAALCAGLNAIVAVPSPSPRHISSHSRMCSGCVATPLAARRSPRACVSARSARRLESLSRCCIMRGRVRGGMGGRMETADRAGRDIEYIRNIVHRARAAAAAAAAAAIASKYHSSVVLMFVFCVRMLATTAACVCVCLSVVGRTAGGLFKVSEPRQHGRNRRRRISARSCASRSYTYYTQNNSRRNTDIRDARMRWSTPHTHTLHSRTWGT